MADARDTPDWARGSIGQIRRALAARLREGGIESAEADARLLMQRALGLDRAALSARQDEAPDEAGRDALLLLAARRLAFEPIARIAGEKEFWGLRLALSPETLVPRPETETVVETALRLARARGLIAPRIADLGTGSGAILLALLHELPQATGIGIDLSAAAVHTAAANADALGLAARARFMRGDFAQALDGPVDIVVSNPPYIPSADIAALHEDVKRHDPHLALDGGADGLAAYRLLAARGRDNLLPDGFMVLELGIGQADAAAALMRAAGLSPQPPVNDLAGIARALAVLQSPAKSR